MSEHVEKNVLSDNPVDTFVNDMAVPERRLIKVGFISFTPMNVWEGALYQDIEQTFVSENGFELFTDKGILANERNIQNLVHELIENEIQYLLYRPLEFGDKTNDVALKMVSEAGIPVILIGEKYGIVDDSLYVSAVANNYLTAGKMTEKWMKEYMIRNKQEEDDIYIAHIAVSENSLSGSVELKRSQALSDAVSVHPNWHILETVEQVDCTVSKGAEIMTYFLEAYPDIDLVYTDHEHMGLGAIEAINAAGKNPGFDIVVVTLGSERDTLSAIVKRELNMTVSVSPLYGQKIREIIRCIEDGKPVEKAYFIAGRVINFDNICELLPAVGI